MPVIQTMIRTAQIGDGATAVVVADSPSMTRLLSITGTGSLFRFETSLLNAVDHGLDRR